MRPLARPSRRLAIVQLATLQISRQRGSYLYTVSAFRRHPRRIRVRHAWVRVCGKETRGDNSSLAPIAPGCSAVIATDQGRVQSLLSPGAFFYFL